MQSFLSEVARDLYGRYGDGLGTLRVLLPSRRGRLFLLDSFTSLSSRPLWEPEWLSMDDLMCDLSGLQLCDRMRLITELYTIYHRYHPGETFDKFYFWGEVLLSDFDQVDKYLIDGDMLFRNASELKDLDVDFDLYMTKEQQERIMLFWSSVGPDGDLQHYKQQFCAIWRSLRAIYRDFHARLLSLGFGYSGLIYRVAAERLRSLMGDGASASELCSLFGFGTSSSPVAVVGFNALNRCEEVLFDAFQVCGGLFYWDYDEYYFGDSSQEAGLFLRDNIRRYPSPAGCGVTHDSFRGAKSIDVVSCSSPALQCKYVAKVLNDLRSSGVAIDKGTAIVLTDESLLLPLLYALPSHVGGGAGEGINVTMGYPVIQSLAYSFVERLLQLQSRCTSQGFYHVDVMGLLSHPYLDVSISRVITRSLERDIEHQRLIRIPSSLFDTLDASLRGVDLLRLIFTPISCWATLSRYLSGVLEHILSCPISVAPVVSCDCSSGSSDSSDSTGAFCLEGALEGLSAEADQRIEFLTFLSGHILQLHNSIDLCSSGGSDIVMSMDIYLSLLRRHLQTLRLPFEGEPLNGPQVLGILETRTLDFENVIILSLDDDNFPGNRSLQPSYIPYNLCYGYGLPTPEHHDGVFAYYFYRLISRCSRLTMLYCSSADGFGGSGEQSRYITQLAYESGHTLCRTTVGVDSGLLSSDPIVVSKCDGDSVGGSVRTSLSRFLHSEPLDDSDLDGGEGREGREGREGGPDVSVRRHHSLSPTALFRYVECPLKFYFSSVAGLRADDVDISDGVNNMLFGNLVHHSMERLYEGAVSSRCSAYSHLSAIDDVAVVSAVEDALATIFYGGSCTSAVESHSGEVILVREIVMRYVRTIIDHDLRSISVSGDFRILGVEKEIYHDIKLSDGTYVTLRGICDRVDRLSDGSLRIVDYKSGTPHLTFDGLEALFEGNGSQRVSNIFQTLLYCYIFYEKYSAAVDVVGSVPTITPALYYARTMRSDSYSSHLVDKGGAGAVLDYSTLHDPFRHYLYSTLDRLFTCDPPLHAASSHSGVGIDEDSLLFTQCVDRLNTCATCPFKPLCD